MLFSSFNSVKNALLIVLNIPLALVGGIVALWLSAQNLSVPASIGFIALFGIALENGMVLVTYLNQLVRDGVSMFEASVHGACLRLRPVLMTATTTALGLLPLLFSQGTGSEVQRPLATVVVGGLISSTVLTLLVIPALYKWFAIAAVPETRSIERSMGDERDQGLYQTMIQLLACLLACLWVLLPLQALGNNLVIPAEPARVDIPDVKFYRISYGFQEAESRRFQLQVNFRYRPWTSHIQRVNHLTFRLQSGTVVQGDDQTLVLRLDNREMVVGRHRWWYAPYWQAADDVRIACDSKRQIRRVILANCRLIIK
jgi:hypothetical protein